MELLINEIEKKELEKERFEIRDLNSADWVFREWKRKKAEREERINYAKAEIETLKAYIENEEKEQESMELYFKTLLGKYVDRRLEEDPKFRLKTVHGSANYGKLIDKWHYEDDVLLKDLEEKEIDEFIKIKKSIDKTLLKKSVNITKDGEVVTKDGEVLNGVKITQERKLNIRLS